MVMGQEGVWKGFCDSIKECHLYTKVGCFLLLAILPGVRDYSGGVLAQLEEGMEVREDILRKP
jgi:hypothetical protein